MSSCICVDFEWNILTISLSQMIWESWCSQFFCQNLVGPAVLLVSLSAMLVVYDKALGCVYELMYLRSYWKTGRDDQQITIRICCTHSSCSRSVKPFLVLAFVYTANCNQYCRWFWNKRWEVCINLWDSWNCWVSEISACNILIYFQTFNKSHITMCHYLVQESQDFGEQGGGGCWWSH